MAIDHYVYSLLDVSRDQSATGIKKHLKHGLPWHTIFSARAYISADCLC